MNFLRLIRFPNLLMIIIVQCLVRYTLIIPILQLQQKYIALSIVDFILTVLSTVLVAAGGFIINDIEDFRIDQVNKPGKIIIGEKIPFQTARIMYGAFTIAGIAIGFYLQFYRPAQYIGYTQLLSAGLLYFYTTTYKGIPLVGNFIVSVLTAGTIALPVLSEPLALTDQYILLITSGYVLFAFLLNMVRELIKDVEDAEGDAHAGLKTLPIAAGILAAKILIVIFILIILILITWIQITQEQWKSPVPFFYLLLLIQIPLLLLLSLTIRAKVKKDFHRLSLLAKGIMICGIFSMLVFYLAFLQ